jgi:hypothetical protein
MPTARTTGHGAATPSSEKITSRIVVILRISTIPSSSVFRPQRFLYRTPSPTEQVDQVDVVDLLLINA